MGIFRVTIFAPRRVEVLFVEKKTDKFGAPLPSPRTANAIAAIAQQQQQPQLINDGSSAVVAAALAQDGPNASASVLPSATTDKEKEKEKAAAAAEPKGSAARIVKSVLSQLGGGNSKADTDTKVTSTGEAATSAASPMGNASFDSSAAAADGGGATGATTEGGGARSTAVISPLPLHANTSSVPHPNHVQPSLLQRLVNPHANDADCEIVTKIIKERLPPPSSSSAAAAAAASGEGGGGGAPTSGATDEGGAGGGEKKGSSSAAAAAQAAVIDSKYEVTYRAQRIRRCGGDGFSQQNQQQHAAPPVFAAADVLAVAAVAASAAAEAVRSQMSGALREGKLCDAADATAPTKVITIKEVAPAPHHPCSLSKAALDESVLLGSAELQAERAKLLLSDEKQPLQQQHKSPEDEAAAAAAMSVRGAMSLRSTDLPSAHTRSAITNANAAGAIEGDADEQQHFSALSPSPLGGPAHADATSGGAAFCSNDVTICTQANDGSDLLTTSHEAEGGGVGAVSRQRADGKSDGQSSNPQSASASGSAVPPALRSPQKECSLPPQKLPIFAPPLTQCQREHLASVLGTVGAALGRTNKPLAAPTTVSPSTAAAAPSTAILASSVPSGGALGSTRASSTPPPARPKRETTFAEAVLLRHSVLERHHQQIQQQKHQSQLLMVRSQSAGPPNAALTNASFFSTASASVAPAAALLRAAGGAPPPTAIMGSSVRSQSQKDSAKAASTANTLAVAGGSAGHIQSPAECDGKGIFMTPFSPLGPPTLAPIASGEMPAPVAGPSPHQPNAGAGGLLSAAASVRSATGRPPLSSSAAPQQQQKKGGDPQATPTITLSPPPAGHQTSPSGATDAPPSSTAVGGGGALGEKATLALLNAALPTHSHSILPHLTIPIPSSSAAAVALPPPHALATTCCAPLPPAPPAINVEEQLRQLLAENLPGVRTVWHRVNALRNMGDTIDDAEMNFIEVSFYAKRRTAMAVAQMIITQLGIGRDYGHVAIAETDFFRPMIANSKEALMTKKAKVAAERERRAVVAAAAAAEAERQQQEQQQQLLAGAAVGADVNGSAVVGGVGSSAAIGPNDEASAPLVPAGPATSGADNGAPQASAAQPAEAAAFEQAPQGQQEGQGEQQQLLEFVPDALVDDGDAAGGGTTEPQQEQRQVVPLYGYDAYGNYVCYGYGYADEAEEGGGGSEEGGGDDYDDGFDGGAAFADASDDDEEMDYAAQLEAEVKFDAILTRISAGAVANFDLLAFIVIASIVSGLGLATDNAVAVLAGSLVSPMMGPILATVMGTVLLLQSNKGTMIGEESGRARGLRLLLVGFRLELALVAIAMFVGFIIGLGFWGADAKFGWSDFGTPQMDTRSRLRYVIVGVLIAIPSGASVVLSMLGSSGNSLVGAAISSSLLPPAVNSGICFALAIRRDTEGNLRRGAISLALSCACALVIYLSALATFYVKRLGPSMLGKGNNGGSGGDVTTFDMVGVIATNQREALERAEAHRLHGGGVGGGDHTNDASKVGTVVGESGLTGGTAGTPHTNRDGGGGEGVGSPTGSYGNAPYGDVGVAEHDSGRVAGGSGDGLGNGAGGGAFGIDMRAHNAPPQHRRATSHLLRRHTAGGGIDGDPVVAFPPYSHSPLFMGGSLDRSYAENVSRRQRSALQRREMDRKKGGGEGSNSNNNNLNNTGGGSFSGGGGRRPRNHLFPAGIGPFAYDDDTHSGGGGTAIIGDDPFVFGGGAPNSIPNLSHHRAGNSNAHPHGSKRAAAAAAMARSLPLTPPALFAAPSRHFEGGAAGLGAMRSPNDDLPLPYGAGRSHNNDGGGGNGGMRRRRTAGGGAPLYASGRRPLSAADVSALGHHPSPAAVTSMSLQHRPPRSKAATPAAGAVTWWHQPAIDSGSRRLLPLSTTAVGMGGYGPSGGSGRRGGINNNSSNRIGNSQRQTNLDSLLSLQRSRQFRGSNNAAYARSYAGIGGGVSPASAAAQQQSLRQRQKHQQQSLGFFDTDDDEDADDDFYSRFGHGLGDETTSDDSGGLDGEGDGIGMGAGAYLRSVQRDGSRGAYADDSHLLFGPLGRSLRAGGGGGWPHRRVSRSEAAAAAAAAMRAPIGPQTFYSHGQSAAPTPSKTQTMPPQSASAKPKSGGGGGGLSEGGSLDMPTEEATAAFVPPPPHSSSAAQYRPQQQTPHGLNDDAAPPSAASESGASRRQQSTATPPLLDLRPLVAGMGIGIGAAASGVPPLSPSSAATKGKSAVPPVNLSSVGRVSKGGGLGGGQGQSVEGGTPPPEEAAVVHVKGIRTMRSAVSSRRESEANPQEKRQQQQMLPQAVQRHGGPRLNHNQDPSLSSNPSPSPSSPRVDLLRSEATPRRHYDPSHAAVVTGGDSTGGATSARRSLSPGISRRLRSGDENTTVRRTSGVRLEGTAWSQSNDANSPTPSPSPQGRNPTGDRHGGGEGQHSSSSPPQRQGLESEQRMLFRPTSPEASVSAFVAPIATLDEAPPPPPAAPRPQAGS